MLLAHAAAATSPIATASSRPPIGSSRSTKARKNVRNPENARSAALARSARTTAPPTRYAAPGRVRPSHSDADPSPAAESTRAGSRIACTVAAAYARKASRSGQSEPISAKATPIGAATATPTTAAIDTREFAVTSATPSSSSRATAAARVTTKALDPTRHPKAAG